MKEIGFDIISDLNLDPDQSFNWENKASSLYCLVAGNVSSNVRTVVQVLTHLSQFYQGVFYVPGSLEYETSISIPKRLKEINVVCSDLQNVCLLYKQVAIIDGIAIIGANGWNDAGNITKLGVLFKSAAREQDRIYLNNSISKLQKHIDIKNIIIVTNAVPDDYLYFGEIPQQDIDQIPLCEILENDLEHKVTHWVFGSYKKSVDTYVNGINYINNPYQAKSPYWPKRLSISI